jgi:hypothetical protein
MYVVRKSDCQRLYRQEIGDEWSGLMDRMYSRCRRDWQYLIPVTEPERKELRSLCEEMLHFERHFLSIYRRFLLGELSASGHRAERARWVMEQIPFEDGEVLAARSTRER